MNETASKDKQVQPIDSRIAKNPITIIRMKSSDGGFLFSEDECLRLLAVFVEKSRKLEKKAQPEKNIGWLGYKPTGRGRLFWRDSE
jgi:hypothetical protein